MRSNPPSPISESSPCRLWSRPAGAGRRQRRFDLPDLGGSRGGGPGHACRRKLRGQRQGGGDRGISRGRGGIPASDLFGRKLRGDAHESGSQKVYEGDTGLNTGGMGAYAPTQLVTPEMLAEYEQSIVRPPWRVSRARAWIFGGHSHAGLMLTSEGAKVLEFNVRFGDPETQVILPLLADDLVPLLLQSARGRTCPKKSPSRTKAPWWWCSPAPDTRKVIPRVKPSALRRKSLGGRRSFMRVLKKTKRVRS